MQKKNIIQHTILAEFPFQKITHNNKLTNHSIIIKGFS